MCGVVKDKGYEQMVHNAMEQVKKVLSVERTPKLPEEVHHKYDDKFALAEFLVEAAVPAQLHCLEILGLGKDGLSKAREKCCEQKKTVTLRFTSEERCTFIKEETKTVSNPTKNVTEVGIGATIKRITSKSTMKVTTWHWNFEVAYQCFAYFGTDPNDKVDIFSRNTSLTLEMPSSSRPRPAHHLTTPIDVNVNWLFTNLSPDLTFVFSIDRSVDTCRTPRRNVDIESALSHFRLLSHWSQGVNDYFLHNVFRLESKHGMDLNMLNTVSLLNPVLPLMERQPVDQRKNSAIKSSAVTEGGILTIRVSRRAIETETVVLSPDDLNNLLGEQKRAITEKLADVAKCYPASSSDTGIVTALEGTICIVAQYISTIYSYFSGGIDYLEELLRKQLISAIGKIVTSSDFTKYMEYHNRKLFKEQYQPSMFSYAVRREGYHPDGVLSIEAALDDGSMMKEINTIASVGEASMKFDINAACQVRFTGKRYLHSYVCNQFSNDLSVQLHLKARATQFCSFVLVLGRIGSNELFLPSHAVLVKNKDELDIPLMLETIPTKKEFEKAIKSISPEMQRFATAYRAMQMEATLFGVAVFQVKPQMEKVLNLPDESLTKEIQLSLDLTELLVKYQIPSDLLSFQQNYGDAEKDTTEKVGCVKTYAENMKEMLREVKKSQIDNVAQQLSRNSSIVTPEMEQECCQRYMSEDEDMGMDEECFSAGMELQADVEEECCLDEDCSESLAEQEEMEVQSQDASPEKETTPTEREEVPSTSLDIIAVPHKMEEGIAALGEAASLRPTIIHLSEEWQRLRQGGLLAKPRMQNLDTDDMREEKSSAFDLIESLTKSGLLSFDNVDMHVVVASTHCFDLTVMDTLVIDNVNPIEKVQQATLVLASVVHGKNEAELVEHAEKLIQKN
eukprot:TRINITY_DN4274_c0_g8_i1.p1 TRINITY_DN4274_c0_g8~~TRINITY_DN4274_c0_g8_i1.p1  ORF type:complete len:913 (+),score=223.43 TRINITY_DN4274_c0_g8_i1:28-2739(+)